MRTQRRPRLYGYARGRRSMTLRTWRLQPSVPATASTAADDYTGTAPQIRPALSSGQRDDPLVIRRTTLTDGRAMGHLHGHTPTAMPEGTLRTHRLAQQLSS